MFWTRLASGIVLVIIALITMSLGGPILAAVLLFISLIAYRELTKALRKAEEETKWNALELTGMAGVVFYYIMVSISDFISSPNSQVWQLFGLVCVFMAEMFVYVIKFPRYQVEQVISAFFAFLYAPVMLSFLYLTRVSVKGIYVVWLILISAWGCDTCAYAVGKLIGKKRIFPVLSPKKSLEGCIGGVLGAALLGGLYGYFFVQKAFPDQNIVWIIAFICAVGAIASMIGDLAASAIKRNHNIKDYGKLIPGHGGIMDRFDSVIVTAPMIYFLTVFLL